MKIEYVAIPIPAEAPEIPKGWTFVSYRVRDEDFNEVWPPFGETTTILTEVGRRYVRAGKDAHTIAAECEHVTISGCYCIYCQFESNYGDIENPYRWSEWLDQNTGKPFVFTDAWD